MHGEVAGTTVPCAGCREGAWAWGEYVGTGTAGTSKTTSPTSNPHRQFQKWGLKATGMGGSLSVMPSVRPHRTKSPHTKIRKMGPQENHAPLLVQLPATPKVERRSLNSAWTGGPLPVKASADPQSMAPETSETCRIAQVIVNCR